MSIFYSINGHLTLRDCSEVSALIEKLGEWGAGLGVEYDPENGSLGVFGSVNTTYTDATELDAVLKSLGKYATAAAIFTFDTGDGAGGGVFAVGPTEEAAAECLSEYHRQCVCDALSELSDQHLRDVLEYAHSMHLQRVTPVVTLGASG